MQKLRERLDAIEGRMLGTRDGRVQRGRIVFHQSGHSYKRGRRTGDIFDRLKNRYTR